MDIDRYCEQSGKGWLYHLPNGYQPSIIPDPRSPFGSNSTFQVQTASRLPNGWAGRAA